MTPFKPWGAAPTVFPAACILPFEPNWSSPVQETLAWRMASTLTQSGAEQRRSLRREPRQSIEFTSAILPGELPLLQSILWGWANSTFAVPLWYGKTRLTNTGTAGASTLLLDDSPETLFQAGGWALIWAGTRSLEAVKIASITGNVLGLDATLADTWPAGTAIAPLQFMQLQDSLEHTPLTSTITQVSWIFSQEPGHAPSLEQWAASTWSEVFPTGADAAEPRNHFFSFPHNWAGSPSTGISTKVSVFDPGISVLSRRAAVDRPTPHWAIDTLLDGRAATAQLRKFLSAHAGATVGFWAASPVADIALTADITGTTLSVVDNGQLAVPSPLRTGVEVVGGATVRELVDSLDATSVTLARDPAEVALTEVTRASWVARARLAVDAITISHLTDRVATCRLPVVAVDTPPEMVGGGGGGTGGVVSVASFVAPTSSFGSVVVTSSQVTVSAGSVAGSTPSNFEPIFYRITATTLGLDLSAGYDVSGTIARTATSGDDLEHVRLVVRTVGVGVDTSVVIWFSYGTSSGSQTIRSPGPVSTPLPEGVFSAGTIGTSVGFTLAVRPDSIVLTSGGTTETVRTGTVALPSDATEVVITMDSFRTEAYLDLPYTLRSLSMTPATLTP